MSSHQIFVSCVLLLLSACTSTASLVRHDGLGGRVQLGGAYMPAMSSARTLMLEHCNGRFNSHELGDAVEFACEPTHEPVVLR